MTSTAAVLAEPQLRRSLMVRQHLAGRVATSVEAEVGHLVGMQAQNPPSPYVALWSRLEGFGQEALSSALLARTVARVAAMRGTIHLLTADDALLLPGLMGPVFARDLRVNATHAAALAGVDLDELAARARDVLEDTPMTAGTLGPALGARWPDVAPASLAYAARGTLPLVQVTPRGVWGHSLAPTWTTARAWLGRDEVDLTDPENRRAALERVALRYLAAFGPASVADLQYWSGLTGLRPVVDGLRERLSVSRAGPTAAGRPGRELFDVPDAPRDGQEALPPRLLPDFDNVTLAHADRSRVVTDEHRQRMASVNGVLPGKLLVGGRVGATWQVVRTRGSAAERVATLVITPLEPLPDGSWAGVQEEAQGLLGFLAADADEHEVVLAEAAPA
ncbi:MAG TPA: winged helix DNA-binding domain-containing protein [Actinotalea sp.]